MNLALMFGLQWVMVLCTLGGLELVDSSFQRPKTLLLLSYLALEGPKERQHLAALLWSEANKRQRLHRLRVMLSQLRQEVPGIIEADGTQVWSTLRLDAKEFLSLFEAGRDREALEHYGGTFLRGFDLPNWTVELEEWIYGTREFLASRAREALLRLGEEEAARGRFERAAQRAEAAYLLAGAPEPEPEDFARCHALLVAGNHPRAADVRNEAKAFEIALALSPEKARAQLCHVHDAAPPRHNLPRRGTSFVGRDPELLEMVECLADADCRLLTLTGPGGAGKSRLAVQAAQEQLSEDQFRDGVCFVALDALTSPELIPSTIADALGLELQGKNDPLAQAIRHLGEKRLLLVLDNFEHLITGATQVSRLIEGCPNLKVLVTSRECLNLEEEWVFPVEGLPVPDDDITIEEAYYQDAVKLFVQRAKQARLGFVLTEENLPYVLAVCRLVQGLPLGIELSAVWVKLMSCAEIAREIEQNLGFLAIPTRNLSERHRSMAAVLERSWLLLKPNEQRLLCRLSIFAGSFNREAAAEVTGATIPSLGSLVDKSLLQRADGNRFVLHALVRRYAADKLASGQELQARFDRYFAALLKESLPELKGAGQKQALFRLERDIANWRLAWRSAAERHDLVSLESALGGLCTFYEYRSQLREGEAMLAYATRAVERHCAEQARPATAARCLLAKLRARLGWFQVYLDSYKSAKELLGAARQVFEALAEAREAATCYSYLGDIARYEGDLVQARALYEEGLSRFEALGDARGIGALLNDLADLAAETGDLARAQVIHRQCLEHFRKLQDQNAVAHLLRRLGLDALHLGDVAQAARCYEESLELHSEQGNLSGVANTLYHLGQLHLQEGAYEEAERRFLESLAGFEGIEDQLGGARALMGRGEVAHRSGAPEAAEALFQQSLAKCREIGHRSGEAEALFGLGRACAAQEKREQARCYLSEALGHFATLSDGRKAAAVGEALTRYGLEEERPQM